MRTREKIRIYKMFKNGMSIPDIWCNTPGAVQDEDIENAIRDVIKSGMDKKENTR